MLPLFDQYARDKENCEGGSNCMCIENFQFVFDGKSIDVGNGKRSKSSNEEEVSLEAILLPLDQKASNEEKTFMISKTFDLFVEDIMETDANGDGGRGEGGGDGD